MTEQKKFAGITTTGKLREALADTMDKLSRGEISESEAKELLKFSKQVNKRLEQDNKRLADKLKDQNSEPNNHKPLKP